MVRRQVEGFVGERRRAERRRMPPEVRSLVLALREESRRTGATTADGQEWRTVRKKHLDQAIRVICEAWREESDACDERTPSEGPGSTAP